MVINQHSVAHGMGSKDADNCIIGWDGLPIIFNGFAMRFSVHRPSQPRTIFYDSNSFSGMNGTWSLII